MAFQMPVKKDIISVIRYLEDDGMDDGSIAYKDTTSHWSFVDGAASCNIARRLTLALHHTYREIKATQSFPHFKQNEKICNFIGSLSGRKLTSSCLNNEEGHHLMLDDSSFPIMRKRYQLIDIMTNGTFSQVYNAVDLFNGRRVAVKVLRMGYGMLGRREVAFLQHLAAKTMRGSQQCYVRHLDSFVFEDHFCVVLDLYDCTLMNVGWKQALVTSGHGVASCILDASNPQGMLQPRAVRPASGSSSFRGGGGDGIDKRGVDQLRYIALRLVSALCVLNTEGIIHADIKPENCFIKFDASSRIASKASLTSWQHLLLNDLPPTADYDVVLGDFGNAIHITEVPQYFVDFQIQSLPFRAPEVVVGIPFGPAIDMWSLGVLLIELVTGKPLFAVRDRTELLQGMTSKIAPLSHKTFSGGLFSNLLMEASRSSCGTPLGTKYAFNRAEHIKAIKRLVNCSFPSIHSNHCCHESVCATHRPSVCPSDLVHFLCGLLMPDPAVRLTPWEALTHPFLGAIIPIPSVLLSSEASVRGAEDDSGTATRRSSVLLASIATLRGKGTAEEEEPLSVHRLDRMRTHPQSAVSSAGSKRALDYC